jgi:hypothetical protein
VKTSRSLAAALFAASVLLHVAALVFLLDMLAPRPAEEAAGAIEVVWASPVSELVPPVEDPAPPQLPHKRTAAAQRVPARAATARRPVASTAASVGSVPAAAEPAAPAPAEPVFDRQAALAAARKLANEPDPTRAGTVGAELDKRKVYAETQDDKMGRTIASGKRSDCIKAQGNADLLTPLLWLLDKKGHGCKL